MIRTYLTEILIEALARVVPGQMERSDSADLDVASLWRRPRQPRRFHRAINIQSLIGDMGQGPVLAETTAAVVSAMLAVDRKRGRPMLNGLEASEQGFINCLVGPELAAIALSKSLLQGGLTASVDVPAVLALPASYGRCQAYLRHARSGVVDILSGRLAGAMLTAGEWTDLQEKWRVDPEIFSPLFQSRDTLDSVFDLILHLADFDEGAGRARLKRYVKQSDLLLERFFADCAADKGFFCGDLSVSKARLGLIYAVMHVSFVGLGIMHLATAE